MALTEIQLLDRIMKGNVKIYQQKASISYTGAGNYSVTLAKGTTPVVLWTDCYYPAGDDDNYVILGRKDSAMSANERDITHADSAGVWIGESYLGANNKVRCLYLESTKKLQIYASLGANVGSKLNMNVVYIDVA